MIVFFWNAGAFISSESPDFVADFTGLVRQYGLPDRFEDRS
jgi:hypothetical protein